MVCGDCDLKQPVSQFCIGEGCGNKFGEYFCKICNFFDDEISKKPFHCDGCGICRFQFFVFLAHCIPCVDPLCRVGGRENFFHCETCGCCYATELRNNHRCIQVPTDIMHIVPFLVGADVFGRALCTKTALSARRISSIPLPSVGCVIYALMSC